MSTLGLFLLSSPSRASEWLPIGQQLVLGRAADFSIEDPRLARRHSALRLTPRGLQIEALDSRHGTFVDGKRVAHAHLQPGSIVRVGHNLFCVDERPDLSYRALPRATLNDDGQLTPLIGQSSAFHRMLAAAQTLADKRALLIGEAGTGKRTLARHMHALSGRRGAFVELDTSNVEGSIMRATNGTLFIPHFTAATRKVALTSACITISSARTHLAFEGEALQLPTLRERKACISSIVTRARPKGMAVEALEPLLLGAWPKNIPELLAALKGASSLGQRL